MSQLEPFLRFAEAALLAALVSMGAKAQDDAAAGIAKFGLAIDWGWFRWFEKPIFWLLKKLFELAVEVGYARFEHAQGRGPWKPSFLLWPVLNKLVASKVLARLAGPITQSTLDSTIQPAMDQAAKE